MARKRDNQNVDGIDIALIRELEQDARQASSDLASKTGISEKTVRRRLQRLLDGEVIRIVALADPFALGYATVVVLGINVERGQVDSVVEELTSSKKIIGVTIVTGRYNILAWAFCQDLQELWNFVTQEIGSISAVSSVETMITLGIWKNSYSVLADNVSDTSRLNCEQVADAVDIKLVTELEIDAMQSNNRLARKLGISVPTVRKRLQRLLDENVIRVVAVANPYLLGYTTPAGILLKVRPGSIKEVSDQLVSYSSIQMVLPTSGAYDVVAWGIFQDTEALSTFVRKELDGITGINSYETLVNLRYGKFSIQLAGKWQDRNEE